MHRMFNRWMAAAAVAASVAVAVPLAGGHAAPGSRVALDATDPGGTNQSVHNRDVTTITCTNGLVIVLLANAFIPCAVQ
jgi:hypothetical protein